MRQYTTILSINKLLILSSQQKLINNIKKIKVVLKKNLTPYFT